jgi:hypothetical protein
MDSPNRRAVLQVVGKRVDISLESEWGDCPLCTRIVAIGAPGAVATETLREKFDRCLVQTPGRRGPRNYWVITNNEETMKHPAWRRRVRHSLGRGLIACSYSMTETLRLELRSTDILSPPSKVKMRVSAPIPLPLGRYS